MCMVHVSESQGKVLKYGELKQWITWTHLEYTGTFLTAT